MKLVTLNCIANKNKENARAVTATYELGENTEESVTTFGDDVVNSGFNQNAVVWLQGVMRCEANKGKTDEQIQAYVSTLKPGVKRAATAIDPKAAVKAALASMTPAERKAYIADLMSGE